MKEHAKKALKHDISVAGKTIPTLAIAALFLVGTGSAALLSSFGTVQGTADVEQAVTVDGPSTVSYDAGFTAGATKIDTFDVTNDASVNASVAYDTSCTYTRAESVSDSDLQDGSSDCDGVERKAVAYYDEAGATGADLSEYQAPSQCTETISDVDGTLSSLAQTTLQSGDTVCISSGTHEGNLVVDVADVTVSGKGTYPNDTVVDAAGDGIPVRVTKDGVTVEGIQVTGSENGEFGIEADGTSGNHLSSATFRFIEAKDNKDKQVVFNYVEDATAKQIKAYGADGPNSDNEEPSSDVADGITFWHVASGSMTNITVYENGDNGVYFNQGDLSGENILAYDNGDEGIDVSLEKPKDLVGSTGPVDLTNVESYSNGDVPIEVEGNDNPVTITGAHLPDNGVGLKVKSNSQDTVSVSESNFEGTGTEIEDNGADVDAANNWFGEDGINSEGSSLTTSYKEVNSETLSAGETDTVGIYTNFDVALAPGDYTVDFDVQPSSAP